MTDLVSQLKDNFTFNQIEVSEIEIENGVVEIVDDHRGDTYRTVYTVHFASAVYVPHAFQKKSKTGIATPRADIKLIERRLHDAEKLDRGERT